MTAQSDHIRFPSDTRAIDELIGISWPNPDIVVLLEPDWELALEDPPVGRFVNDHFVVRLLGGSRRFRSLLYHELGHYYFTSQNASSWLREGAPENIQNYALWKTGRLNIREWRAHSLQQLNSDCKSVGISNVQELLDATMDLTGSSLRESRYWPCHYDLGQDLLLQFQLLFGTDAVGTALQSLYELPLALGRIPDEAEIHQVFSDSVPGERLDEFNRFYAAHHGGQFQSDQTAP